jgi:maltodextrin utilization protein YvdJ
MALDPKRRAQLEREGARSRKDVEEWLFDQDEKATRRWSRIKQRATVVSLLALILVLLVTIVARTLLHRSRNNRASMIEQHVTAARIMVRCDGAGGDLP